MSDKDEKYDLVLNILYWKPKSGLCLPLVMKGYVLL